MSTTPMPTFAGTPEQKAALIYKMMAIQAVSTGTREKRTYEEFEQLADYLFNFELALYKLDNTDFSNSESLAEENKNLRAKIDHVKLTSKMAEIREFQAENSAAQTLNLDCLDPAYLSDNIASYMRFIDGAKNMMNFILPEFRVVPFFAENLILLGAKTGAAKTHTGIEITYSVCKQTSNKTGKPGRVFYYTNEETSASVVGRLAFRYKGWAYTNLQDITPEEQKWVMTFQKLFVTTGQLVVIDDNYPGLSKTTSSIDGLEVILGSILKNKNQFDCIVIDYFHKIISSKSNPGEDEVKVLTRVCDRLDYFRKFLGAPIVLLAQLKPESATDDCFEQRIKGRKRILEASTFAAEICMDAKAKTYVTSFKIEKNRLVKSSEGTEIKVGYSNGKYVSIDSEEFREQRILNEQRLEEQKEAELQLPKQKGKK